MYGWAKLKSHRPPLTFSCAGYAKNMDWNRRYVMPEQDFDDYNMRARKYPRNTKGRGNHTIWGTEFFYNEPMPTGHTWHPDEQTPYWHDTDYELGEAAEMNALERISLARDEFQDRSGYYQRYRALDEQAAEDQDAYEEYLEVGAMQADYDEVEEMAAEEANEDWNEDEPYEE